MHGSEMGEWEGSNPMTIHFTCTDCGSLLKIKDELAGTNGKCPKCKTSFVVPEPMGEDSAEILVAPEEPEEPQPKSASADVKKAASPAKEKTAAQSAKSGAKQRKSASDDDFDPAEFLMGDGPKRSAPAFDSSLDEPDEPRPKKTVENESSSRPEKEAGSRFSTSDFAKEMMMKAKEESRLHAGDPLPDEGKGGFDYSGFMREVGLKAGGGTVLVILLAYGLYVGANWMMASRLKLPPLGYVTGKVTLDGTPLAGATVYFAPVQPDMADTKRDRARTSYGITDDQGEYTMIYYETTQGVAIGKCQVWLELLGPKGQVIPPDWTKAVLQVREVKAGSQVINFEMKSAM